jgi:hypothetical protein
MSTALPPALPQAARRPTHAPDGAPKFLSPMAMAIGVFCIVSALGWAGLAAVAAGLHQWTWLNDHITTSDLSLVPPSVRWLGRHAVAFNVAMLLISVVEAVSCWGLLRRQRWALWLFLALLVMSIPACFLGVWLMDDIFGHLLLNLPAGMDEQDMGELRRELQMQRIICGVMTGGTALVLAAMHVWLVLRLLRQDVQKAFKR